MHNTLYNCVRMHCWLVVCVHMMQIKTSVNYSSLVTSMPHVTTRRTATSVLVSKDTRVTERYAERSQNTVQLVFLCFVVFYTIELVYLQKACKTLYTYFIVNWCRVHLHSAQWLCTWSLLWIVLSIQRYKMLQAGVRKTKSENKT